MTGQKALTTWQRRVAYAAMSALLAWHTLAIIVAPAADNMLSQRARTLIGPYLAILGLNNGWSFFAPHVENGLSFRYEVTTADGVRRTFAPLDELSWYNPVRRFFRDRFRGLLEEPEIYADAVGAALCAQHAELKPTSVTLTEVEQKDFDPADRLAGKSPFDAEFLTLNSIKSIPCPAS